MALHPDVSHSEAGTIVPYIIAWAIREHSEWLWKGCYRPYVDPGARDSY